MGRSRQGRSYGKALPLPKRAEGADAVAPIGVKAFVLEARMKPDSLPEGPSRNAGRTAGRDRGCRSRQGQACARPKCEPSGRDRRRGMGGLPHGRGDGACSTGQSVTCHTLSRCHGQALPPAEGLNHAGQLSGLSQVTWGAVRSFGRCRLPTLLAEMSWLDFAWCPDFGGALVQPSGSETRARFQNGRGRKAKLGRVIVNPKRGVAFHLASKITRRVPLPYRAPCNFTGFEKC